LPNLERIGPEDGGSRAVHVRVAPRRTRPPAARSTCRDRRWCCRCMLHRWPTVAVETPTARSAKAVTTPPVHQQILPRFMPRGPLESASVLVSATTGATSAFCGPPHGARGSDPQDADEKDVQVCVSPICRNL